MYSIVDIETTGGSATHHKITEIAVFELSENGIIKRFHSLINPEQAIPQNISQLTGISNEMVIGAPLFIDIAEELLEALKGNIFVAHNVNFDYRFIKAEFQRNGIQFKMKKLCTVRLSRKIIPGYPSYSLGKLCQQVGIKINGRHRAAGDAEATAILFQMLLEKNQAFILDSLKPKTLESLLPANINKSDFMALPETAGLYYFKDAQNNIIYIGKAKNIKKRVHSHFSGNTNTGSKSYFLDNVHSFSHTSINNEFLLDLMEASEIKKYWPRYNRALKRVTLNYGLIKFVDRNGYIRLNIIRPGKFDKPLIVFKSRNEIFSFLRDIVFKYQLCPRLAGLQPIKSGACNYIEEVDCLGACTQEEKPEEYNFRVERAIEECVNVDTTFIIKEKIIQEKKTAIVLVEKGRYKGFGKIEDDFPYEDIDKLKSKLNAVYDDQDMSILIHAYLSKTKGDNLYFYS